MIKIEIKRLEKMLAIFSEIQEAQLKFKKFDHLVQDLKKNFEECKDKKSLIKKILNGVVLSDSEIIQFLRFIINKL